MTLEGCVHADDGLSWFPWHEVARIIDSLHTWNDSSTIVNCSLEWRERESVCYGLVSRPTENTSQGARLELTIKPPLPSKHLYTLVNNNPGLPLLGRPILLITRMITDRTGLNSVLLPLLIELLRQGLCFVEAFFKALFRSELLYRLHEINIAWRG